MAESPTSSVVRPAMTCFRRRSQLQGGTPPIWGSCYSLEEGVGARCSAWCRSSACLRRPVVPSACDFKSSTSSSRSQCTLTRWFRKSSQSADSGHEESCEWCGETLVMGRLGCRLIEQVCHADNGHASALGRSLTWTGHADWRPPARAVSRRGLRK